MSLYKDTYETIVTNIANSIYERTKNIIINISPDKNMLFYDLTTSNTTKENNPVASKRSQKIVSKETITSSRTKPTQDTIKSNLKTFLKTSLGFTDSTFNQIPNGNEMLSLIFAVNFFLEKSLTKVSLGLDATTILYTPVTSGFTNRISSHTNDINNSLVTELYNTLKNVNCANNTGGKLEVSGGITSSCSSSSCSSSSSSSSSSSCSSSSVFIVYFNL